MKAHDAHEHMKRASVIKQLESRGIQTNDDMTYKELKVNLATALLKEETI